MTEVNFCPLCSRESVVTCDGCKIQFCDLHHTSHDCEKMKRELEKEKAQAWLAGQEYSRRNLNLSVLQKVQKEKELEEMREMIEEAVDEITEGEESGETAEQTTENSTEEE